MSKQTDKAASYITVAILLTILAVAIAGAVRLVMWMFTGK